jgi:hypothetical protein
MPLSVLVMVSCSNSTTSATAPTGGGVCGGPMPEGGTCNAVVQRGALVQPTCAPGAPPRMTGGTVANGTYILTSETEYGCPEAGGNGASSETFVVSGACIESIIGSAETVTDTASWQGNQITIRFLCPPGGGSAKTYTFTATSTTLAFLLTDQSPQRLQVFTKM